MCKFCTALRDSRESNDDIFNTAIGDIVVGYENSKGERPVDMSTLCEDGAAELNRRKEMTADKKPLYEANVKCKTAVDALAENIDIRSEPENMNKIVAPVGFNFNKDKKTRRSEKKKRVDLIDAVESWTRSALSRSFVDIDDAFIRCLEIKCGEPGCPPYETVSIIDGMAWSPAIMTIRKQIDRVEKDDVSNCVRELWSKWRQWECEKHTRRGS